VAKEKRFRYDAITRFGNVIEMGSKDPDWMYPERGRWAAIFGNDHPITLELACGKGDYTLELARRHPERNFIGVDIKGDRIYKGAKIALEEGLTNVRFLRIYIDHIVNYFAPAEVDGIWITFPDPYLNEKKKNKRLTAPVFLERYRQIVTTGGRVKFKTDDPTLDAFTLQTLGDMGIPIFRRVDDVHGTAHGDPLLHITTYYERNHLAIGRTIRYTEWAFEIGGA
jgi:tRNA (guanine-N7-)-methyltransferase